MAVLSVDMLRRRVDYSITVFRAGLVTLVLAALAFVYLLMATTAAESTTSILIIVVTLAVVPVACVIIGLSNYAMAVTTLRTVYGDRVSGLLRRRSANLQPATANQNPDASLSNIDEASWRDIISRLGEDESR